MPISAARDANRIGALIVVSSTDGTTPLAIYGDPITHRLYVDALTGQPTGYSTVTSATATNSTAGTAVQFASAACKLVSVFVPTGNTSSQIAIGGSNVKAASGSEVGLVLISGSTYNFYVTNTNLLWFDVGTNGDKISYNYYV